MCGCNDGKSKCECEKNKLMVILAGLAVIYLLNSK